MELSKGLSSPSVSDLHFVALMQPRYPLINQTVASLDDQDEVRPPPPPKLTEFLNLSVILKI